jgi:hypothetical protein
MPVPKKKRQQPGKCTYFPRVQKMTLSYPPSETGGTVEIVKGRQGNHRVIADEAVTIRETIRRKPEKS